MFNRLLEKPDLWKNIETITKSKIKARIKESLELLEHFAHIFPFAQVILKKISY